MDPFRTTNVNFAESMGFELGESSPSISRGEGDISMQRRAYVGPKRPDPQQHSQQGGRSHGFSSENGLTVRNLPPTFSVMDDKKALRRATAAAHSNSTVNMASPSTSTSFSNSHVHFGPLTTSPALHSNGYALSNPNFSHRNTHSGLLGSGIRSGHEVPEHPNRTRDNLPIRPGHGGSTTTAAAAAAPQNTPSYSVILQDEISYDQNGDGKSTAVPEVSADSFMSPPSNFPTLTSLPSSALSSLQLDALWNTWVVVFGYDPHSEQHSLENMLHRFSQYGEIENHSAGRGNWIFIKYVSPNQAERACSRNGSFLNSGTMIAVSRMNPTVASSMGVGLCEGGLSLVSLEADFSSGDNRRQGDRPLLLAGGGDKFSPHGSSSSSSSGVNNRLGRGVRQVDGVPFQRQALQREGSSRSSAAAPSATSAAAAAAEEEDLSDIYVKPPRRPSICKRVMEYLFSFKY